jgi:hypothetical protein
MKKYLILLTVSLAFWSCIEEPSRDITTDLGQEANQFFGFSEAMAESTYLGNLAYSDYTKFLPGELPGCPAIVLTPDSRIVTLDYSNLEECVQENREARTGQIVLDFTFSNLANPTWTMSYTDYTFDGIKIQGTRTFRGLAAGENEENFENLKIELTNNLNFIADGTLSHKVTNADFVPVSLSSLGRIEGKNPAGRNFFLTITEAREQLFTCYQQGWHLPRKGQESWVVARGASNSENYVTNVQSSESCNPVVVSTLPDGRTLQLNP